MKCKNTILFFKALVTVNLFQGLMDKGTHLNIKKHSALLNQNKKAVLMRNLDGLYFLDKNGYANSNL